MLQIQDNEKFYSAAKKVCTAESSTMDHSFISMNKLLTYTALHSSMKTSVSL